MDIGIMSSVYGASTSVAASITTVEYLICTFASIILGLAIAGIYMFRHSYSKNFVVTLALLPLIVQVVITLVNGNLGAGIAVMGVFNLVRFRSIPGTAKDIASVFMAMAVGLATGMGYIGLGVIFTVIIAIVNIIYVCSPLGKPKVPAKMLVITVPEDLEFDGMFDEILGRYTHDFELSSIQTSNMGSLYTLEFLIHLKEKGLEKHLIDEVRCLNGNLKITLRNDNTQKFML